MAVFITQNGIALYNFKTKQAYILIFKCAGKTNLCNRRCFGHQVSKLDSKFKIPDYREAVHFAIDRKPKIAMVLWRPDPIWLSWNQQTQGN
jgi:hypothetical protein